MIETVVDNGTASVGAETAEVVETEKVEEVTEADSPRVSPECDEEAKVEA